MSRRIAFSTIAAGEAGEFEHWVLAITYQRIDRYQEAVARNAHLSLRIRLGGGFGSTGVKGGTGTLVNGLLGSRISAEGRGSGL